MSHFFGPFRLENSWTRQPITVWSCLIHHSGLRVDCDRASVTSSDFDSSDRNARGGTCQLFPLGVPPKNIAYCLTFVSILWNITFQPRSGYILYDEGSCGWREMPYSALPTALAKWSWSTIEIQIASMLGRLVTYLACTKSQVCTEPIVEWLKSYDPSGAYSAAWCSDFHVDLDTGVWFQTHQQIDCARHARGFSPERLGWGLRKCPPCVFSFFSFFFPFSFFPFFF